MRGLLGPSGPKSVQPVAARPGLPGDDQLRHFVSSAAMDDAPLWRVPVEKADRPVGGDDAMPAVDEASLPKKRGASDDVASQYRGALGKQANCLSTAASDDGVGGR